MTRSKTVAAWLAFLGGPLGLHRFYLYGLRDVVGWLLPVPTLLGAYGFVRGWNLGVDDRISWVLVPLLGFTIAGCALNAIVYGLRGTEQWNARFNPREAQDADAGATRWNTIFAIVAALMIGTGVLMATLAYSFEHYFEDQVRAGREISQ